MLPRSSPAGSTVPCNAPTLTGRTQAAKRIYVLASESTARESWVKKPQASGLEQATSHKHPHEVFLQSLVHSAGVGIMLAQPWRCGQVATFRNKVPRMATEAWYAFCGLTVSCGMSILCGLNLQEHFHCAVWHGAQPTMERFINGSQIVQIGSVKTSGCNRKTCACACACACVYLALYIPGQTEQKGQLEAAAKALLGLFPAACECLPDPCQVLEALCLRALAQPSLWPSWLRALYKDQRLRAHLGVPLALELRVDQSLLPMAAHAEQADLKKREGCR